MYRGKFLWLLFALTELLDRYKKPNKNSAFRLTVLLPTITLFSSFSLFPLLSLFYPPRSGGELNTSYARESHQIGCQRLLQASPLQGWVRNESVEGAD